MLAAFGILPFDTRKIYQSFQKGLSGSYALPDYDAPRIEGYHASGQNEYSENIPNKLLAPSTNHEQTSSTPHCCYISRRVVKE